MSDDLAFRLANESEDDELARVIYNAFVPIWNHNWFQCLSTPLDTIPSGYKNLTPTQSKRLAFYRSWLHVNRAYKGNVSVAYTQSPASGASIAAVCLLLPPHARPSLAEPLIAWRTGILPAVLSYGLRGFWRVIVTFEGNVGTMISKALKALKVGGGKEENLLFIQGCVRNPEWEGRGPARRLLDWSVRKAWDEQENKGEALLPVWLDTTIDPAVRAYEAVGFKVVGECMVDTGADEQGVKLRADAGIEEREKGRIVAKQRVMLRMPED